MTVSSDISQEGRFTLMLSQKLLVKWIVKSLFQG